MFKWQNLNKNKNGSRQADVLIPFRVDPMVTLYILIVRFLEIEKLITEILR